MQADKLMYQAKEHKNMVVTEDNASYVAPGVANRKARQQILIVDDSEMNRAILSEMLKRILIFWRQKTEKNVWISCSSTAWGFPWCCLIS